LRQELYQWTPTKNFRAILTRVLRPIDSAEFFCRTENQELRDASLAGMFGDYCHARQLRLVQTDSIDFEVELRNGKCLKLQSIEADRDGRQRGKEYRDWKLSGYPQRDDPFEEWEHRRRTIPAALETAVKKKIAKNYGDAEQLGLLIYLNLGTYGYQRHEIEIEMVRLTEPARDHFRSVWVYWSGRLYRCWPNPSIRTEGWFRPKESRLAGLSKTTPLAEILG